MGGSSRRVLGTATYYLICTVITLAFLFPTFWAVVNSFKPRAEAAASPPSLVPEGLSVENNSRLAEYGDGIWLYLWNTVQLSVMTVVFTVIVSTLAGYGFARYHFRGKQLTFLAVLAILMVPFPTILLPLYLLLNDVGLLNSLVGVALVLTMFQLPFSVFMMRNAFESMPVELEEAALVDGATSFGALRRISLRIVTPSIVTVALFAFIAAWNEFLAPLIFLTDASKYTLPLALVGVRTGQLGQIDYGSLYAGITVAMVPCAALFLGLQRYYLRGLTSGALKG
jgi:multiple sugar transport system permease protein